jgi:hypothetical protein
MMLVLALGCGDDVSGTGGTDTTSTGSTGQSCSLDYPMLCMTEGTVTLATTQTTSTETTVDPDSTSTDGGTSTSTSTTGEPFDPFGPSVEQPLDLAFEPLALALADFDGDGALDLLVTGTAASVVTGATLLGDGAGGFGAAIDATVTACSAFPIFGAIDDDAAADLFFGTCGVDDLSFTSNGDGTFSAIDLIADWSYPPVRSSQLVDHDGDGDDDLVLLTVDDIGQARLHVATNDGPPPWAVTTTDLGVADPPGFAPNILASADLDADAIVDAVLVQVDVGAVWFRGVAPAGHEGAGHTLALDIVPSTVRAARLLGDDAVEDLALASRTQEVLQLVRGDARGPAIDPGIIDLGGIVPLEIAAGDFDGDGDDDLATVDVTLPTFVVLENGTILGPQLDLPSLAVRLLAGDLDGDTKSDLVAATYPNGSITVLLAQ